MNFCRRSRLAEFNDWRLATVTELEGMYDLHARSLGRAGAGQGRAFALRVRGGLFLTGLEWSSDRRVDDRGHPNGYDFYFDFYNGRADNDPSGFLYSSKFMRALCVRGPTS